MSEFNNQRKRQSFDYRGEYLKHHPGVFGRFYVCSQCGICVTKDKMEVDHVLPVSKWYGPNKTFNCVSTCVECNRLKSDKVGWCTVRGFVFKLFEEIYILINRVSLMIYLCSCFTLFYIVELFVNNLTSRNFIKIILTLCSLALICLKLFQCVN